MIPNIEATGADFAHLLHQQEATRRWRAEWENASARYELAQRNERAALLLSQHQPVSGLGLDRERLRLVLAYLIHGDIVRLNGEHAELRIKEAREA